MNTSLYGNVSPLIPARGLREFSTPADRSTFTGTSGIHFNCLLGAQELLAGFPYSADDPNDPLGASYLSQIHGSLGSDPISTNPAPLVGNASPARPAFAGPEVTGYASAAPFPATGTLGNGFDNTETLQRLPSANPDGNGTVWVPLQGRNRLSMSLWISSESVNDLLEISVFKDPHPSDKSGGAFGADGTPPDLTNALPLFVWTAYSAPRDAGRYGPNFRTASPVDLPGGSSVYILFRNLNDQGNNLAVGSLFLVS